MTLYHATYTKRIRAILQLGLLPDQKSNWINAAGFKKGDGSICACESRWDAIRWAHKLEWDTYTASGTGATAVVAFDTDPLLWSDDADSDPLTYVAHESGWLKSRTRVPAQSITAIDIVIPAMIRELVTRVNNLWK